MSFTHGDLISLIALILGIQALFSGIYLNFLQGKRRKLIVDVENIKRNSFYLDHITKNTTEAIIGLRVAMEHQNSVIHRMILGDKVDDDYLSTLRDVFLDDDFYISKNMQTLLIYTDDLRRRESAFKQIAERFGDAQSLNELIDLRIYEKEQRELLERSIEMLTKRLNTNIH